MMASQALLRVSIFALLVLDVHGLSVKGSQSQHQGSSGVNSGGKVAGSGHTAPVSYSAPSGVYKQDPSPPRFMQAQPVFVGVSSMPETGYSSSPVPAGYYSSASFVPSSDAGAPQSSLPEAKWTIAPQAFEEASANTQTQGSSFLPPPPGPPVPALQSGETSNVVKEAELGNYQQQTEEFGYPANSMGPGPALPPVAMPGFGGLWGYSTPYPLPPYPFPYPYPYFDYRLLYGLYPPGTYTTFSKEHEKGKDYYQTIHYLKEHGSDSPQTPQDPGTGQQKVFPDES